MKVVDDILAIMVTVAMIARVTIRGRAHRLARALDGDNLYVEQFAEFVDDFVAAYAVSKASATGNSVAQGVTAEFVRRRFALDTIPLPVCVAPTFGIRAKLLC